MPEIAHCGCIVIRQILLCVDFSESDRHAVSTAVDLALQLGASVELLHVVAPEPDFVGYTAFMYPGRDERADELRHEKTQLAALTDQVEAAGVAAKGFMKEAPTVDGILEFAGKHGHDLIVVGRHGKGLLGSLLMGSVAKELARRSPVLVLVVPPAASGS